MVMTNIIESTRIKYENGDITLHDAARKLHKAGITNFVDEKRTLELFNTAKLQNWAKFDFEPFKK